MVDDNIIDIDTTKKDIYSNPFPYKSLEISTGSLNMVPDKYKTTLQEFSKNIKEYLKPGDIYVDSMTKSALTQNMNDLVEKFPWNQPSNDIGKITKNYISDKLARITKLILIITKRDKDKANNILKPLELITLDYFNQGMEKVVDNISKKNLKVDIG